MKATLNEVLRLGFEAKQQRAALPRFRVTPVDLGDLAPGIDLDRIADALEMAEGPAFK
ncbi:MAG TPA: hypothetical protein VGZ00_05725 [Candidatus Baltobacteraceae bacterium]|nr:hypothetical protein [Candidatus Baltobacteraceae bacterium]